MATIASLGVWVSPHARRVSWEGLANGDDGSANGYAKLTSKTVQVSGDFGTGGTVEIEGSNDGGTSWNTLEDESGSALSLTAAGIHAIAAPPELIRPRVSAGDSVTALNVYLLESADG